MIEVWFSPIGSPINSPYDEGEIKYRHKCKSEYLGISQQLFAQMMGWA